MAQDPKDPRAEKKRRLGEAFTRVVSLIGREAVDKLLSHGFQVVVGAEFNNFVLAYQREVQRLRDLHAASERDAGRVSARVEVVQSNGTIVVHITSPTCDEVHLGKCLAEALAPAIKDFIMVRFDPKAVSKPEPILPPENAKGGSA